MDTDPQLQKAILASIYETRALSSGGPRFGRAVPAFSRTSYAHERHRNAQRRPTNNANSNSILPRGQSDPQTTERHCRVDSLRRSGITPSAPFSRTSSPGPKRPPRRAISGPQSGSPQTSVRQSECNETSVEEGSLIVENGTENGQWKRIRGSGSFHVASVNGTEEGYLENTQAGMCLISQCQEVAPDYSLQFEFRCAHAAPASGNLPAFRLVLFAENDPSTKMLNHTSILVDCRERFWTVEHTCGNRTKEIYKVPDRDLRPGVFHVLRLELRQGNTMSIFCGERSPINNLKLTKEAKATGPMGLAVSKSRLDFRRLKSNLPSKPLVPGKTVAPYTADDRHLVEIIEKDVIEQEVGVTFKDIASLDDAKRLLDEAVTLPLIIPEFFTGIREPWKGVLLFGPPGTGKTLLAKALANMHNIKFFNCSSSMLMSKWRGESEKLVRVLFGMARHYAPSIVFFDEADALISTRGGDGEHEASRRFKSELLQQMDGVASVNEPGKSVMVLATSNCPWDLDEAMRRRFEKRIYIPLPDDNARAQMLRINLKDVNCGPDVEYATLSKQLAGYSGADIRLVCRDASLMPMRRLISDKTPEEIIDLRNQGHLEVKLTMQDFEKALGKIQPSVSPKDVRNFEKWNKEFASV